MRLRYLLTPTRGNAEATKWFIFGVSNFCLQIIYRCYVSPLGGYNRLLSWLDAAVGAVQASQAGARRRYTFDRPSAAIGTTNAVPGRPDRRRYVVIGDKNSYLESCTITRCGCVGFYMQGRSGVEDRRDGRIDDARNRQVAHRACAFRHLHHGG